VSCGFAALTLDRQPGDHRLWRVMGEAEGCGRRSAVGVGAGCRTAVHSLFRGFVLAAPLLLFEDGGEDDPGVGLRVGFGVGPDEPGSAVGQGDGSGEPFDLGGDDASIE